MNESDHDARLRAHFDADREADRAAAPAFAHVLRGSKSANVSSRRARRAFGWSAAIAALAIVAWTVRETRPAAPTENPAPLVASVPPAETWEAPSDLLLRDAPPADDAAVVAQLTREIDLLLHR